jgi:hypothetical protein
MGDVSASWTPRGEGGGRPDGCRDYPLPRFGMAAFRIGLNAVYKVRLKMIGFDGKDSMLIARRHPQE